MPTDRPWKLVTAVSAVAGLTVVAGSLGRGPTEAIAAIELDTVAEQHPSVVVGDRVAELRIRPLDDGGTLVSPVAPVERDGQVLSEASAPSPPEPADRDERDERDAPTPPVDSVETPGEPVTAVSEGSVDSADSDGD